MADKENLLLLYDRPLEPSFVPKGPKNAVFLVPYNYLPDRYKSLGVLLANKYGGEASKTIPVKEIKLPRLGEILDLKRNDHFALFVPKHRYLAGLLIDLFLSMRNINELQSLAIYARDRVNPYLFSYAFSVALLHRKDTQDLDIPSVIYSFPDKFIQSSVFGLARESADIIEDDSKRTPIIIPLEFSGSNLDPEHRVAYFREDLGINLHHWHWHLVYPASASLEIVNKNRRGELFYYMHQQILARYNTERLCHGLSRTKRFINWREPIKEGYFPKLSSPVASREWAPRVENERLQNINREQDLINLDIDELIQWRDHIMEAIRTGAYIDTNRVRVPFTEFGGIDILGNIIEASSLTPNGAYYGDLHNLGHMIISLVHDPDGRHLEPFGVMADTPTAMRDPIFYRWHTYINYMFETHKMTLPRYTVLQLNYPGVTVTGVSVQTPKNRKDQLRTFWQQSDIDLSRGIDFIPGGAVTVRVTHLQHRDFTYTIMVRNDGGLTKGTCRIFIAPKLDERGREWLFRDHRSMFVALDRFTVDLTPGVNIISRSSTQSTVTIPWEQTFRNLDFNRPTSGSALAQFNFCGCGWPHHMLLLKGTPEGLPCYLFVMISNYTDDQVIQDVAGQCNDADNYCGIKDKLYPDRRSMGYPFDRMPRRGVSTLQEFLTSNMRVQEVSVIFEDQVFLRPKDPTSAPSR